MIKANFHTHTTWCDGSDTPEDVVLSAIGKGFSAIGFSSHMSFPGAHDWALDPNDERLRFGDSGFAEQVCFADQGLLRGRGRLRARGDYA